MLETPLAIIALSGPPVNQIMRRAKEFGWHSLFSTSRFPTLPSSEKSDSLKSSSGVAEAKGGLFSSIIRKKESSGNITLVPSKTEGSHSNDITSVGAREETDSGLIQVTKGYSVV